MTTSALPAGAPPGAPPFYDEELVISARLFAWTDRFLAKIEFGEHWIWTAHSPQFTLDGRHRMVRHLAYELVTGGDVAGRQLVPGCEEQRCIRPLHMAFRAKQKKRAAHRDVAEDGELIVCRRCEQPRRSSEFSKSRLNRSGRQAYCRHCMTAYGRVHAGVRYDHAFRLVPAGQRCEICGEDGGKRSLHFDHDHRTGVFRGWLCHHCNAALGRLRDNPDLCRRAAAYLEARGGP